MHVVIANCYGVHRWKAVSTGTNSKRRSPSPKVVKHARTSKKGSRSAPVQAARDFPSATTRKGVDGRYWAVKRTKAGHKTWVRTPTKGPRGARWESPPRRKRSPVKRARTPAHERAPRASSRTGQWEPASTKLQRLKSMAKRVLVDVHQGLILSTKAAEVMAKIAAPLERDLARFELYRALSNYYGKSHDLIKHSLSEASKGSTSASKANAVLEYLFAELNEVSGNMAMAAGRETIRQSDVIGAMRGDTELVRVIKYA